MGSTPVFPYRPCSLLSNSRLPASRHETILQPKRNVQHLETTSATAHLTCSWHLDVGFPVGVNQSSLSQEKTKQEGWTLHSAVRIYG